MGRSYIPSGIGFKYYGVLGYNGCKSSLLSVPKRKPYMDIFMDFAIFCSQNAWDLHGISLLLRRIITEQLFYYGKTDKRYERKNTRCCY